jgi:hypothetical protein
MKILKIIGLSILGLFGLMFIVSLIGLAIGGKSKAKEEVKAVAASTEVYDPNAEHDKYVKTVQSYIPMLTKYEPSERATPDLVVLDAVIFYSAATEVIKNRQSSDTALANAAKQIEKRLVPLQQKEFPKLRKAYAESIYQTMWKNDIYVTLSGSRNSTIRFTGGVFASNKNIDEFLSMENDRMWTNLKSFRFKRIEFCWYKGQDDDIVYYTTKVPSDDKVATLESF